MTAGPGILISLARSARGRNAPNSFAERPFRVVATPFNAGVRKQEAVICG